jgi:sialate O-acetylesterase
VSRKNSIAGEDKVFFPAEAAIMPNKSGDMMVWSNSLPKPFSIRYSFKASPQATLFNTAGLPASSF